jgi:hypothetical protein
LLIVFAITLLVGGSAPLVAQKPVTQGAVVTETFVIDAIDHGARLVTLRDPEGQTETIYCGPGVERFDALKVGDKVTFRYHESLVYQIRKPGSAVSAPSVSSEMVRTPGDRPGGTISDQIKTTVTVNAVDVKVPSITVTTAEGKKMSFKVENAKNLEGIVPGDKVEITYTVALAISVTSPGR